MNDAKGKIVVTLNSGTVKDYEPSDTEMIDFLEMLLAREQFTGKCILRQSTNGRGWRLHETEMPGSSGTVRGAISNYMNECLSKIIQNTETKQ